MATDDDPLSHLAYREAEGKRPGGFGMLLTAKLVDEVHYNERGNEVFLVKHLDKLRGREPGAGRRRPAKKRVLPFSGTGSAAQIATPKRSSRSDHA